MLYLVKRLDHAGYDEYVGFVVRAKNKDEAIKLCQEWGTPYEDINEDFRPENVTVEVIDINGESGIILDSFNAS
jgi:hypothetical protein